MVDFTNPNPKYWFNPEFAKPKEIPNNAKIKYFLIDGKRKRFRVWFERSHEFREIKGIIWRTVLTRDIAITNILIDEFLPKIKNIFERDDIFYSKIKR